MRPSHAESIRSDGEYGIFEGSIHDEVVHGHYRREGTWSPEIQALLADQLFPEGRGTFLDIGANIGLVSIPLAERRRVRCLAFEPEPRNFQWLERNIASARGGLSLHHLQPGAALRGDAALLRALAVEFR